jgi:hypothetical protein
MLSWIRFFRSNQTTKGAPINEVILFSGIWITSSKNKIIQSQKSKKTLPINALEMSKMVWFVVLNQIFTRLGTAKPTNEIGPQKAVVTPVKIAVLMIITNRVFLT